MVAGEAVGDGDEPGLHLRHERGLVHRLGDAEQETQALRGPRRRVRRGPVGELAEEAAHGFGLVAGPDAGRVRDHRRRRSERRCVRLRACAAAKDEHRRAHAGGELVGET